jgi:hypothetical protein
MPPIKRQFLFWFSAIEILPAGPFEPLCSIAAAGLEEGDSTFFLLL